MDLTASKPTSVTYFCKTSSMGLMPSGMRDSRWYIRLRSVLIPRFFCHQSPHTHTHHRTHDTRNDRTQETGGGLRTISLVVGKVGLALDLHEVFVALDQRCVAFPFELHAARGTQHTR
jgi:hypothetical protein